MSKGDYTLIKNNILNTTFIFYRIPSMEPAKYLHLMKNEWQQVTTCYLMITISYLIMRAQQMLTSCVSLVPSQAFFCPEDILFRGFSLLLTLLIVTGIR